MLKANIPWPVLYTVIIWDSFDKDAIDPSSALGESYKSIQQAKDAVLDYMQKYPSVYRYEIRTTLDDILVEDWNKQ